MVWDVLGIMIGFATIMLLFSILVTTINQVLIALLDLKATHFRNGINAFKDELHELVEDGSLPFSPNILALKKDPTEINQKLFGLVTTVNSKQVTELPEKKLKQQLVKVKQGTPGASRLTENEIELVIETFKVYEQKMFETFKKTVSKYSVFFALIIAIGFQLNPFTILNQLSHDEQYREKLVKYSQDVKVTEDIESFNEVKESVLIQLTTEYQQDKVKLEEISLADENKKELRDELELVLENSENKTNILNRYDKILADKLQVRFDKSLERFKNAQLDLNAFGFRWWPDKQYYSRTVIDTVMNIIAAVFSALLIALGAPFWYNLIGTLSSLKDKKVAK